MSSSRLPAKVLADLAGVPLIRRVYERVASARHVHTVHVLTSEEASDDPLCEYLLRAEIPFRRGPLQDVLARYEDLVAELDPTYVVRVTGDAPLVDPDFIDMQLEALAHYDGDWTVCRPRGEFEGVLGGQTVLSARALRKSFASENPLDREHVGSFWMRTHRDRLRCVELWPDAIYRDRGLRLCVDEEPDLDLVRALYEHLAPRYGSRIPLSEALAWVRARPELARTNQNVPMSADNRRLRALRPRAEVNTVGRWPLAPASEAA